MRTILWTMTGILLLAACQPAQQANEVPLDMVAVPASWFWMGQDDGPLSSRPQRRVYLDGFNIDRTEVTRADFAQFIEAGGLPGSSWGASTLRAEPDLPVTGVLWSEAASYCQWSGKRLPTEAEWEKAARGSSRDAYPWGSRWNKNRANTLESGIGGVVAVGSYPKGASPCGALDLIGNAAEWVADTFDSRYYTSAPDHNPPGPSIVTDHVLRGGSYASPKEHASVYFRDSSHSARPNPRVGFRCAQTMPSD